jgi:hypothetical protein
MAQDSLQGEAISSPYCHCERRRSEAISQRHIVIASDEEAKQSPLLHVMQLLKARSDPINQKLALLLAPRNDGLGKISSQRQIGEAFVRNDTSEGFIHSPPSLHQRGNPLSPLPWSDVSSSRAWERRRPSPIH